MPENTRTATRDPASDERPDLFDPANSPDFVNILRDIRDNEEIFFYEGEKYRAWIIARHDQVVELLRDERLIQPSLLPRIAAFPEEQKTQLQPLIDFAHYNLGNFLFDRYPDMQPVEGGMEVSCQPMLRRYITRFDLQLQP